MARSAGTSVRPFLLPGRLEGAGAWREAPHGVQFFRPIHHLCRRELRSVAPVGLAVNRGQDVWQLNVSDHDIMTEALPESWGISGRTGIGFSGKFSKIACCRIFLASDD